MSNKLTRFNPFGELARLEPWRDIEDLFSDFRLRPGLRELEAEPRIKMDVAETDQGYMVKAEIPGVKKEDIKVEIEGNQVSISAETQKETEQKQGETVVRSERYYGKQYRRFTLAHEIDEDQAQAKYQDGVLELSLPKKSGPVGARQLSVQ
ncbi:MAG TPA: Hsp20/alpha crystallin family protein [Burkholderiaceae bacterium]|nr:Hsp20/alpha crystallin family protein [Burkholderiaceae bacterium]